MDLSADQLAQFVEHARWLDVKEGDADPDSGSNAIDDGMTDVLVDTADDPTEEELRGFISALNDDQKAELVALVWVGRGDYEAEDFPTAVAAARARRTTPVARYLLGIPNVADLAAEGYAAVGERDAGV
jgi:hypothetical protein